MWFGAFWIFIGYIVVRIVVHDVLFPSEIIEETVRSTRAAARPFEEEPRGRRGCVQ